MTQAIRLAAPAKLNLTLEVVRRLANGYHAIRSVFVRLPRLADTIAVELTPGSSEVRISSDSPDVPCDATNLCHRAAMAFFEAIGERAGARVHIDKRIPVAAGLGGGSSDAAAVLIALDQVFPGRVGINDLVRIGAGIGKDVPFFLGGTDVAFVSGMGETVEAMPPMPDIGYLIVNPRIAVPTGPAYAELSRTLWFMESATRVDRSQRMRSAIGEASVAAIANALYNDFEVVVEARHPVVKDLKQAMAAFGAQGALMSGSGPTVYGVFASADALQAARAAIAQQYPGFVIAVA